MSGKWQGEICHVYTVSWPDLGLSPVVSRQSWGSCNQTHGHNLGAIVLNLSSWQGLKAQHRATQRNSRMMMQQML